LKEKEKTLLNSELQNYETLIENFIKSLIKIFIKNFKSFQENLSPIFQRRKSNYYNRAELRF